MTADGVWMCVTMRVCVSQINVDSFLSSCHCHVILMNEVFSAIKISNVTFVHSAAILPTLTTTAVWISAAWTRISTHWMTNVTLLNFYYITKRQFSKCHTQPPQSIAGRNTLITRISFVKVKPVRNLTVYQSYSCFRHLNWWNKSFISIIVD